MSAKTLGFTGTRNIGGHEEKLTAYLQKSETHLFLSWAFDQYVTGACKGWDAFIGEFLALTYPNATHTVLVPADQSQVDRWWEGFDLGKINVIFMPPNTDYRYRNEQIVQRSDYLFYCADYPEDDGRSKRSGTWMTKRIAEKAGVPLTGIVLNK